MPELEELKRRLMSLQKASTWAKVEAAEELIENTVRVLDLMNDRVDTLEFLFSKIKKVT